MADGSSTRDAELLRQAEEVAGTVQALRRLMLRPFGPDIASSGLTVPQMGALEELAREDGLSLKELSGRMGLSHSTVSGIVDRLEKKGFVGRTPDPEDRRYSRIFLSEGVGDYVRDTVPARRLGPISRVLALASAGEREQILLGIGTLRRLLLESSLLDESEGQRGGGREQQGTL